MIIGVTSMIPLMMSVFSLLRVSLGETPLQHLVVAVIFAICLYWVVRRILRTISRAKHNTPHCDTCTETSCPLREAAKKKKCDCGCH